MTRGGNKDASVIFFIRVALPDSPPSLLNFQPQGCVSPETLLENISVNGSDLSAATEGEEIETRQSINDKSNFIIF